MITLKSSDGEEFEVEEAVAMESQTIRHMIEDDCADNGISLPNVNSKILSKVIEYCNKHVAHTASSKPADAPVANSKAPTDDLKNWDAGFVKVDQATLFDLILAANYLNIKGLLDLTCQTIADLIKGKTPIGEGMSKRQRGKGQANYYDRSGNKQKNLYLVLDDWNKGFTIRKIDADSPDLSDPPVLRLMSPARRDAMKFAALGSKILATSNQHPGTLVYDTDTVGLAIGHPVPDALLGGFNIFLTTSDALFAFAYYFMKRPQSFEVMTKALNKDLSSLCPSTDWSWKSLPVPFTKDERICSYALHPDGCTIFVSLWSRQVYGTFSFDTTNYEWRRHGEWMLPFEGQGYFDDELDAWVGLHEDGYICSCQVASCSSSTMQQPDWKMFNEYKMWSPWHQVAKGEGATLTFMGNTRYCLIDCVVGDGLEFQDAFGDVDGCVLNITTFRLRYNHEGKLRIIDRNTSSCPVSKHLTSFSPVAFWM